jgi:hypothetical protein
MCKGSVTTLRVGSLELNQTTLGFAIARVRLG